MLFAKERSPRFRLGKLIMPGTLSLAKVADLRPNKTRSKQKRILLTRSPHSNFGSVNQEQRQVPSGPFSVRPLFDPPNGGLDFPLSNQGSGTK